MTPPNGKFKVISLAAAGASVSIPSETTHIVFAGTNSSTHVHAKIDGTEFIVIPGTPIALVGSTLSNSSLSGTAWTHASFLAYRIN